MKRFAVGLLFVTVLFACSLPNPGCDDHSCDGCKYVLKAHAEKMIYHLGVECLYDSACNATLVIFLPVPKEKNECKMDNFEYTLVSGNIREKNGAKYQSKVSSHIVGWSSSFFSV